MLKRNLIATLVGVVAVIAVFLCYRGYLLWLHQFTTVYVVRHAEKANDGTQDPPLSAAGQTRAEALAHVLGDAGIDAIYVTQFQRTQLTAADVAGSQGVTPQQYGANDAAALVADILANHIGEQVLVVGHSNTVDDIAAALGVSGVSELAESAFDRMLVIHRFSTRAHLDRLRYGAPSL